ncbi:hypothetical protein BDY17DRAFT_322715 [Neohortaea acidophila]|uniref:Uncharacterized protein n=1 Tax=Neohortaea acidophila TaxID=245834 RepID=A0A6A6PV29_9PEZI|nr:uncharacterized protein BDY17DRAFT_322715 [Neohortaea acidophila]KAF2483815.1 hypothetical protein BDY17DRAFT_322715 [Neohortaea acidophila]
MTRSPTAVKLWLAVSAACLAAASNSPFVMTFNSPGTVGYDQVDFVNALVIGNRRLGAAPYG